MSVRLFTSPDVLHSRIHMMRDPIGISSYNTSQYFMFEILGMLIERSYTQHPLKGVTHEEILGVLNSGDIEPFVTFGASGESLQIHYMEWFQSIQRCNFPEIYETDEDVIRVYFKNPHKEDVFRAFKALPEEFQHKLSMLINSAWNEHIINMLMERRQQSIHDNESWIDMVEEEMSEVIDTMESESNDCESEICYHASESIDDLNIDSIPDLVSCSSDDDEDDEDEIYMMEIVMSDDENTISDAYDSDEYEELGNDDNWFLDVDGCWGD